ncbi:MAG: Rieske 2Fe-2S domain-containing protein [Actinobacteria bacterium]|nr:Rieske 2Fe-2S domain-containing protein [Actinomycetota bacterium]
MTTDALQGQREWLAGEVAEFEDGGRKTIQIAGDDVVVFRFRDRYCAVKNVCPHMGGPVGDGMIISRVEAVLTEDQRFVCERFSEDEIHLVCPWHGWEFQLEGGECAGDPRIRLRMFDTEVREGQVYVIA